MTRAAIVSSTTGNQQWLRHVQVVVGSGGTGLSIEKLRISFEITKTVDSTPNIAQVKIYNLSPDHEAQVRTQYEDILINAGYRGAMRLIFRGTIKHAFHYRDKCDQITQIEAADGEKDYRQATMNLTLAAGTTPAQLVSQAAATMGSTTVGYIGISGQPRIRGRVYSGMTRDVLSHVARTNDALWSIQDGALQIVPAGATLPNQAVVVNSATGMLKAPEINDKGIRVTCLLNPQIGINGVLQLNNNDIMVKRRKMRQVSKNTRKAPADPTKTVALNADGLYKVIRLDHRGDNRGAQFETESYCVGLGQPIPASSEPDDSEAAENMYEE
jgi:hypothetical protein